MTKEEYINKLQERINELEKHKNYQEGVNDNGY